MNQKLVDDFGNYVVLAGTAILDAMFVCDLSTSADKMMSFDCVGTDNIAWKEGPFISSGANQKQIDRSHPYLLAMSKETSVAVSLVLGGSPEISANGGAKLPLSDQANKFGRAARIVAKLIIVEQFELFKDFWRKHDGPINSRKAEEWAGRVDVATLTRLKTLTDRRNELVHSDSCENPSIREAVEYYFGLRVISESLAGVEPTAAKNLTHIMK